MRKHLKFTLILTLIISLLFTTSCMPSKAAPEPEKKTVQDVLDNGEDGIYIMDKDGMVSPLISLPSFTASDEYNPSDYIWWANNNPDVDNDALIPRLDKDSKLVAIYASSNDIPKEYTLRKYESMGYTFGSHISISENGTEMHIEANDPCPESSMENALSGLDEEYLNIQAINGDNNIKSFMPSVDTDLNMLLANTLQQGQYYTVSAFVGTTIKDVNIYADTHVCKERDLTVLDNPLRTTENQYFVIELPANLQKGFYYYINDLGMFYY